MYKKLAATAWKILLNVPIDAVHPARVLQLQMMQGLAVSLFDNTFATAMKKTKHTKRTIKQNFSQEEV